MLGLRCFAHDLVASSRGYSPVAVHGLLMWRLPLCGALAQNQWASVVVYVGSVFAAPRL